VQIKGMKRDDGEKTNQSAVVPEGAFPFSQFFLAPALLWYSFVTRIQRFL
jgi:hypothetical protein